MASPTDLEFTLDLDQSWYFGCAITLIILHII